MAVRTLPQQGSTALKDPASIKIAANPDVADFGCCQKCLICCFTQGGCPSKERSYIYVRENSVEYNVGIRHCIMEACGNPPPDHTYVSYFDRNPFVLSPYCGCNKGDPQIRLYEPGFMCCCMKCTAEEGLCTCLFNKKAAVITPFDTYCCCCPNKTKACCFGLGNCFGPVEGNPRWFSYVFVQPQDAETFVAAASEAMTAHRRGK